MITDKLTSKFWAKTTVKEHDCWLWKGKPAAHGHGQLVDVDVGKVIPAHRYSYELHLGSLRKTDFVLHECGNKLCVNPSHLRLSHAPRLLEILPKGMKRCPNCRQIKAISEFFADNTKTSKIRSVCKICSTKQARTWQKTHPERKREHDKRTYRRRKKPEREKRRLAALTHYSPDVIPRCSCLGCNETRVEFLSIDHINGGGTAHRKNIKMDFWLWLERNGYPEGFRTLCYNCNLSLGFCGYCPHEREIVHVD